MSRKIEAIHDAVERYVLTEGRDRLEIFFRGESMPMIIIGEDIEVATPPEGGLSVAYTPKHRKCHA